MSLELSIFLEIDDCISVVLVFSGFFFTRVLVVRQSMLKDINTRLQLGSKLVSLFIIYVYNLDLLICHNSLISVT